MDQKQAKQQDTIAGTNTVKTTIHPGRIRTRTTKFDDAEIPKTHKLKNKAVPDDSNDVKDDEPILSPANQEDSGTNTIHLIFLCEN